MKNIYLDNASTTPIDIKVLNAMYNNDIYGNPSSIHFHGRSAKALIENCRNKICDILEIKPNELFFTSGGTESNNTIIYGLVYYYNIKYIITSPIEHVSVLNPILNLEKIGKIKIFYIKIDHDGNLDYNDLLLKIQYVYKLGFKLLVSIMHANNEIGILYDIKSISSMCSQYNALYHCDSVQTIGHLNINDLCLPNIDCTVFSAHKLHGPKGIGFLYINNNIKLKPLIIGGDQEIGIRAGTENILGIIGMTKALEIAYNELSYNTKHIYKIKSYMIKKLINSFKEIYFNGKSNICTDSIDTILNVIFPVKKSLEKDFILKIDINNISVSNGSACSSGANKISHVINHVRSENIYSSIRFSFSKLTTINDIDYTINKFIKILNM